LLIHNLNCSSSGLYFKKQLYVNFQLGCYFADAEMADMGGGSPLPLLCKHVRPRGSKFFLISVKFSRKLSCACFLFQVPTLEGIEMWEVERKREKEGRK